MLQDLVRQILFIRIGLVSTNAFGRYDGLPGETCFDRIDRAVAQCQIK